MTSALRRAWLHSRLQMYRISDEIPTIKAVEGLNEGLAALSCGPVLVAFPHVGPFEAPARLLHEFLPHRKVTIVTDDVLAPPAAMLRRNYGWHTVAIDDLRTPRAVFDTLHNGDIVVVSCDVLPPGQPAVTVEFRGTLTQWPSGPARFAMKTGAGILPVASYLVRGGARVVVKPLLHLSSQVNDPTQLTQELADVMTELVDADPDQWFPAYRPVLVGH